ncbi:L-Ala-D/L-Glu epimerase [Halotalea alkalilenta]|uniref:L-Ala-D/L-Glu epimerase n=1 Tax=Halotalea alkalilenta TaxID=376489 RepID=UPI000ACABD27|nr:L-Ala-D/L-Glu epimerase [Halotalea alkalilenta]
MSIQADYATHRLPLARPFAISRGTRTEIEVVRVTISDGAHQGIGEATPTPRYEQTTEVVVADLERVLPTLRQGLERGSFDRDELARLLPAGVARNAIDCALWSLEAQKRGVGLETLIAEALGEAPLPQRPIDTVQTIGIATAQAMAEAARAEWEKGARLLKVKLDGEQIEARMRAIRQAVPQARLVVDANEAFPRQGLEQCLRLLAELGVEMVEQPLPAGEDAALDEFRHPLPVCADESCHTREDLPALARRYEMVNIKLDKCGGLSEGIAMLAQARALDLKVMVGCMLGSSTAMRAALPLAARATLVDLDGPTWLANDPDPRPLRFAAGTLDDG